MNFCEAVGGRPNGTLAEGWNGSQWSRQTTKNPTGTGGVGTQLESVTCRGGDHCTAVGGWTNQKNVFSEGTLGETYYGGKWSILNTPSPSHSTFPVLYGVSCVPDVGCEAVGTQQPSGTTVPLAEGNAPGSKWVIQSTPDTGLASYTEVTGVSCNSYAAVVHRGGVVLRQRVRGGRRHRADIQRGSQLGTSESSARSTQLSPGVERYLMHSTELVRSSGDPVRQRRGRHDPGRNSGTAPPGQSSPLRTRDPDVRSP